MDILKKALRFDKEYLDIVEAYRAGRSPLLVTGVCDAAKATVCAALAEDLAHKLLIVVGDEKEAYKLKTDLSLFFDRVFVYPARDFVLDDVISYSKEFEQERISILAHTLSGDYDVIITVPDAAMQYTIPTELMMQSSVKLTRGMTHDLKSLTDSLTAMGYNRTDVVEGAGQFSLRGGILDVFSPQYSLPFRVDFFGDEIDLIGFFDSVSQRRVDSVDSVECLPCTELLYSDESRTRIKNCLKKLISKQKDNIKSRQILEKESELLDDGRNPVSGDKFFSLLYEKKETIRDYIPDALTLVFETRKVKERARAFAWQHGETIETMATSYLLETGSADLIQWDNTFISEIQKGCIAFDAFIASGRVFEFKEQFNIVTKKTSSFGVNFGLLLDDIEDYVAAKRRVLILTTTSKAAEGLLAVLQERSVNAFTFGGVLYPSTVAVGVAPSATPISGFELPLASFVLMTDTEIAKGFGEKQKGILHPNGKKNEKVASYADLSVGDLVVHTSHGIGKYCGIQNLVTDGVSKDYIKIMYAGADVLYVPCDQLDMISKFVGGSEESVKLSKMGGAEWQRTKARARHAASNIAKELIKLYAERRQKHAYQFSEDDAFQREFEELFEFTETEGQLEASREIKKDMQSSVPMDRLLCGDVGFGKTEVALRAVFKCVLGGKQAAILVPTTILAWQHYQTMLSRFRGFPINVEMLSRFRDKRAQSDIIRRLSEGKIDVIVGTHRLIQKDVAFKDLGLMIVDEEQRFGVTHKEKLKQMSANIHALTLTATPIPRTMNMALAGIRDMSVLEEAPSDRLPVQTFVLEHDPAIIFEAIRKELRRGGQVFYLHNFVESIYACAAKLSQEFPDSVIAVAHGRMEKDALSKVWEQLVRGEIDILVCTTIIETGVDVPNANTLIIEQADRMGLSQLHQIRGRVGRSARKAYAYLTYIPEKILTEISAKRLEALREYTEFGAGFKIAMRDLELRGAGNVLGSEQHGHMEAIGYDLYIKLLEEAVNLEKGIDKVIFKDCVIDISVNAYIPERYIESTQLRIDVYKKIAYIDNENERVDLEDELTDRFGDIPKPVTNLMDISLIRNMASGLKMLKVEQKMNIVNFYFTAFDSDKCMRLAGEKDMRGSLMISPGVKPYMSYRIKKGEDVLNAVKRVLKLYIKISQN